MNGERGPVGDHGQEGHPGRTGNTGEKGAPGKTGDTGARGATGAAGTNVLTKAQTLALFGFLVFAFVLLAYRAEYNSDNIQDGVVRQDKFIEEVCTTNPDVAPRTCAER